MFKIQTLNAISDIIYTQMAADQFAVSKEEVAPDGVLVRSASMHDVELPESLLGIARAGAGVNNIPLDKCTEKGVVVFNTPGANANAVAELVLGGLVLGSRDVAGGMVWAQSLKGQGAEVPKLVEKGKSQFVGPELRGKTLGVIGLGAIGAIVANGAALGFGMNVIGYDPFISVDSAWNLTRSIGHAMSTDEVLAKADYITFHIPLTDKTRGTINEAMIAKMKPGAVILNFSRAELADSAAVKAALATGQLACYVTDFPTDDMLGVEHVVCIPHLGASTPESEENCARMAAAQLRDYLQWGSIHNSVNLPELPLGVPENARVMVIHENIPNMLANISTFVSQAGINIDNMINKSRKQAAVTVMEMAELPSEKTLAAIAAVPGVIRIRTFVR